MFRKFAKFLPYCVLMFLARKFCGDNIKTEQLGNCRGFRIDKGEWVLYSEQNYKRMRDNELKSKQSKLDRRKDKLIEKLNKDYDLKEEIKKEFKYEEQREKEDFECS